MRRKPKYLDRDRREARKRREFWEGAKWSPTQRLDLLQRQHTGPYEFRKFYLGDWPIMNSNPTEGNLGWGKSHMQEWERLSQQRKEAKQRICELLRQQSTVELIGPAHGPLMKTLD